MPVPVFHVSVCLLQITILKVCASARVSCECLSVVDYYPESVRQCPCFIRHKSTLVSPSVLRNNTVPYDKVFHFSLLYCSLSMLVSIH